MAVGRDSDRISSSDTSTIRLQERIWRVAQWVAERPMWLVAALLVIASLLRNGIVVWNWFELSPGLLTLWNSPASAFQSNVLFNALGTAWTSAGLDPTNGLWLALQVAMTLGVFVLMAVLILRRTYADTGYLALALVLSGGVAAVLWREIGRYDALFVAGILLALLANRVVLAWVGAFVAALASPEQLLAAALLLLLLAALPIFRTWLTAALRLGVAAISVLIAVQAWFIAGGTGGNTRIGVLLAHLGGQKIEAASAYDTKQSFTQFTIEKAMVSLSAGPGLVWSYLGASVLALVLLVMAQRTLSQGLYLMAVVVALPIVAGFTFGEDRTRDISLILGPVIIALAIEASSHLAQLLARLPGRTLYWLNWVAILASLIPLTYFYLYAEEPFRWLKELAISLNNGVPIANDGSAR